MPEKIANYFHQIITVCVALAYYIYKCIHKFKAMNWHSKDTCRPQTALIIFCYECGMGQFIIVTTDLGTRVNCAGILIYTDADDRGVHTMVRFKR